MENRLPIRRNVEQTRKKILSSAFQIFAEKGFDGLTTRALCRKAKVTSGTLYYHFSSKESLYTEAIRNVYQERYDNFIITLSSIPDPVERLRAMIKMYVSIAANDRTLLKFVKREQLQGDPQRLAMIIKSPLGEQANFMYDALVEVCGSFNPHLVATSIMGMILQKYEAAEFWTHTKGYQEGSLEPDIVADHIFKFVSSALGLSAE